MSSEFSAVAVAEAEAVALSQRRKQRHLSHRSQRPHYYSHLLTAFDEEFCDKVRDSWTDAEALILRKHLQVGIVVVVVVVVVVCGRNEKRMVMAMVQILFFSLITAAAAAFFLSLPQCVTPATECEGR